MRRLSSGILRAETGETLVNQRPRCQLTRLQVSKKLLDGGAKAAKQTEDSEFALPDTNTLERLNELATAKLSEIVRHSAAHDRGWRGYSEAEVAAARELLSEDASKAAK